MNNKLRIIPNNPKSEDYAMGLTHTVIELDSDNSELELNDYELPEGCEVHYKGNLQKCLNYLNQISCAYNYVKKAA